MQNDNEKKRLIESTAESYGSANSFAKPARTPPSRWRFFATLTLVIFIFRGSEEMAGVTLKQYVYAWSKNQTAEDNDVTGNTSSNNDGNGTCGVAHESDAQKLASNWELYLNLLLYALLFFSISFAGTMSDYFGRKRFMCLAILGYCVKCVVISIVIYFDLHIAWIFMANGIDGICGSSYCISMVTYSSVADATTGPRERVIAISVSVTILGLSMMSTQFGTGYFIADYGFFYPMVTAASGCMLAFMLAIFFHTEIRNPSQTTKHKTAPSLMTLAKNYVSFYAFDGTGAERLIFVLNITIFFMAEMASQATSNPRTLLQLGHPFCWSSEQLGLYNTVYLGGILTVGCLVLVVLQRCLSDPAISCVGLLSGAAYMVVTGMAPDTLWAFLGNGGFVSNKQLAISNKRKFIMLPVLASIRALVLWRNAFTTFCI